MTAKIWISSGEGEVGRRQLYDGTLTVRALRSRLTRERCGGARWAKCLLETADRRAEEVDPETAIRALNASVLAFLKGTDLQTRTLYDEARAAGDTAMEGICATALHSGDDDDKEPDQ